MKIIRPENVVVNEPKKEENLSLIIDGHKVTPFTENTDLIIDDNTDEITEIMDSVIKDNVNTVTFKITLTKRQYELYTKKGGICWLKKVLVGQKMKKKVK